MVGWLGGLGWRLGGLGSEGELASVLVGARVVEVAGWVGPEGWLAGRRAQVRA